MFNKVQHASYVIYFICIKTLPLMWYFSNIISQLQLYKYWCRPTYCLTDWDVKVQPLILEACGRNSGGH